MSSRFLRAGVFIALLIVLAACSMRPPMHAAMEKHYIEPPRQQKIPASETALRVCADPNNLPFSNEKGEGFENKIADLLGADMGRPVEYTWWAQRRGFFRNTLREGKCDVVVGVPNSFELADTTQPYYRSTYVFVSLRSRHLDVGSFDDPALRDLKVGVQMIGDDGANTPPAHALSNRGMVENIKGYTVYGDYAQESPPSQIVNAVLDGDVDIAVVWGPLAGYYAGRHKDLLDVRPVSPQVDLPYLPFVYDISVGVRRGEDSLKAKISEILDRRRADIDAILERYHVPRADAPREVETARRFNR